MEGLTSLVFPNSEYANMFIVLTVIILPLVTIGLYLAYLFLSKKKEYKKDITSYKDILEILNKSGDVDKETKRRITNAIIISALVSGVLFITSAIILVGRDILSAILFIIPSGLALLVVSKIIKSNVIDLPKHFEDLVYEKGGDNR